MDLSTLCINSCHEFALGLDQGVFRGLERGETGGVEPQSWVTAFLSPLAGLSKNISAVTRLSLFLGGCIVRVFECMCMCIRMTKLTVKLALSMLFKCD